MGWSRTTGRLLPEEGHVYGYKPTPDKEGVKESKITSFIERDSETKG